MIRLYRVCIGSSLVLPLLAGCGNPSAFEVTGDRATSAVAASASAAVEPPAPGPAPADFHDGARSFAAVKDALLAHYPGTSITEDDLYRAAAQGMLEHVDPKGASWNKLLTPGERQAMLEDLRGEIVGVGIEIDCDGTSGYAEVERVLPGSPAERAGLLAGDRILDVDGRLIKGKSEMDVVMNIRGRAGEPVSLSVLREDKVLPIRIVRQVVSFAVVEQGALPDKVGYLRIKSFNAKTAPAVLAALGELAKAKPRALVIDLRSNPGGGFEEALSTAEQLLPAGAAIVKVEKRDEPAQTEAVRAGATVLSTVPMVVLVNHDTASSAEVLASALRAARGARLVGKATFGKWTVQELEDLPNGYAVRYTVARLLAPDGKSYDGVGLTPDVEVDLDRKGTLAAERATDLAARLPIDAPLRAAVALLTPP